MSEYLDHEAKLGAYRGPSLLMHAEHDRLVTIDHAERNYAWLGSADESKALIRLPRGDHNSIMFANQARYESELRDFLRAQLGRGNSR